MFWLRKTTIIRLYISENKKDNYIAAAIHMYGYSCIMFSVHFLIHTALCWLLYAAETCSCFGIAIIKVVY